MTIDHYFALSLGRGGSEKKQKDVARLLLADIFTTSFGPEGIKRIDEPKQQSLSGSRIDLKFVNNPELSDVMFR